MTSAQIKPVAVVGLAVVDRLYRLREFPHKPGKYFSETYEELIGGIAANAALSISRLGADARLVSRIGDDTTGKWILNELEQHHVDTSNVAVAPNGESPNSSILVDKSGERIIVNHKPPSLFADSDLIDTEKLSGVGAVLSDLRWSAGAEKVFGWAQENGIPTVLDYDQAPETIDGSLLTLASHVVFAEQALRSLTDTNDLKQALLTSRELCPNALVAVTAGSAGVWSLDTNNEAIHIPARKVKVTHTVGAGDVFHGAITYALAQGMGFFESLVFANDAAALKVSSPSGTQHLPTLQDVLQFKRNYTPCH